MIEEQPKAGDVVVFVARGRPRLGWYVVATGKGNHVVADDKDGEDQRVVEDVIRLERQP